MKSLFSGVKNLFWPREVAIRLRRAELTFWAFLLAVAYLPLPLGFIAWFALVRPLAIIANLKGKAAFQAAYFYSFMANLFQLYWVAVVTPPGIVAAVFILSLYPAIILLVFNKLYHYKKAMSLIALPVLWVGMEYFRSLSEFAFPWTDLSYSQGYYLVFIQIISVLGCYGLSFILIVLNVLLWQALSGMNCLETRVSTGIGFLGLLGVVWVYGWVVFPPLEVPGNIKVALLQGNVDLNTKWQPETRDDNFVLYDSMAVTAAEDTVDLIVWPETAAPAYPRHEPKYRKMLSATAVNSGVPNLLGALDVEFYGAREESYNAAFQYGPDGSLEKYYHKIKLVPFSEHSPYQDQIPFLSRKFIEKYARSVRTHEVQWWSDFYSGDSIIIFEIPKARYSVLICFEAAFPDYVRQGVLKGAEFIVNITNDTWFGRTSGPYQHMRIAVFRAVENRIFIARCANSGISAIIDPYGRETVRAGWYVRKIITGDLYPLNEYSTFTRIGPILGKWSLVLTVILIAYLLMVWFLGKLKGRFKPGDPGDERPPV
nr:apolipoprotein N-acyltransferase [candidate division Zixibacteria bacterium]